MATKQRVLVLAVDRDDDVGVKAGVEGPIVGRAENLEAAAKLALSDPSEADANAMFAAVKVRDEIENKCEAVEVATLSGDSKKGFAADQKIAAQLSEVLENFPADGIYLVTDGADDDTLIPVLQSQLPIISKHLVRVKQAVELERTYFVIKEALKEPEIAKVVFLIPGLVLFSYVAFGVSSLRAVFGVLGLYLIARGTNFDNWAYNGLSRFFAAISLQRLSFPFYLATILFFLFFVIAAAASYFNELGEPFYRQLSTATLSSVSFLALSGISFVLGRLVDVHYLNLAHNLRRYIQSLVSVLVLWHVVTVAVHVALGLDDFNSFSYSLLLGLVALAITSQVTKIFTVTLSPEEKPTGTPVFDSRGRIIGELAKYDKKHAKAVIKPRRGKPYDLPLNYLNPRIEGVVRVD
ncbi:MAG TPA: DUF373 family protein [archaeon]|nr:DUF373 family protein [archaeon]